MAMSAAKGLVAKQLVAAKGLAAVLVKNLVRAMERLVAVPEATSLLAELLAAAKGLAVESVTILAWAATRLVAVRRVVARLVVVQTR